MENLDPVYCGHCFLLSPRTTHHAKTNGTNDLDKRSREIVHPYPYAVPQPRGHPKGLFVNETIERSKAPYRSNRDHEHKLMDGNAFPRDTENGRNAREYTCSAGLIASPPHNNIKSKSHAAEAWSYLAHIRLADGAPRKRRTIQHISYLICVLPSVFQH